MPTFLFQLQSRLIQDLRACYSCLHISLSYGRSVGTLGLYAHCICCYLRVPTVESRKKEASDVFVLCSARV